DVPLAIGTVNTGITAHFQPGTYATDNVYQITVLPAILWTSTLAHIEVHVSYAGVGYHNLDGTPNAAFYALAASISPILDEMLPAWATYSWHVNSSHGQMEFLLDEKNLDLEAFGLGAPPSFPGSGLAFRFRSDLGVTPGATFTWADQSGNGHTATQATGVQQPTLTYGGINGLPYLAWGAAINLKATIAALAQPCEFFVVFATTAPGTVQ